MQRRTQIEVTIVLLVILFSAGYIIGRETGAGSTAALCNEALTRYLPAEQSEVYSYNGQIKEISGNAISLEVYNYIYSLEDYLKNPTETEIIKIVVNEQTAIKKVQNIKGNSQETSILFSDLKVGDYITAGSDVNVKGLEQFTASWIFLSG